MTLVVAVKPGARHTGVVVRNGDQLAYSALVTRSTPLDWYIFDVVDHVTKARDVARNLALADAPNDFVQISLAVEDVDVSQYSKLALDLESLLETAQVLGAIVGTWKINQLLSPDDPRLEPQPLSRYPEPLNARGVTRHLRGAWDLAAAAIETVREEAAAL